MEGGSSSDDNFDNDHVLGWKLCKDYLQGAWKQLNLEEIEMQRISGGLTNHIYICSLPKSMKPRGQEPSKVLLRLYGANYGENQISKSDLNNLVLDNVIFTILSERRLGPKLYGVFAEGRLEEYIPARSMSAEEIRDPKLSDIIARKIAKIHKLTVPISKDSPWLSKLYSKYHSQISQLRLENVSPGNHALAEKLLNFNFSQEIDWLNKFLSRVHSPIVFCHNDVQGGNILIRNKEEDLKSPDDKLMFIDYEFCGYNYRAFDIANHMCEWMYDYTNKDFPFFHCQRKNFPTEEKQLDFLRSYLAESGGPSPSSSSSSSSSSSTSSSSSNNSSTPTNGGVMSVGRGRRKRNLSCDQQTEILFQEVQAFILAAHLLWCMWGVVHSTNDKIPFGYWEYSSERLNDYLTHKDKMLGQVESRSVTGLKRVHEY